MFLPSLIAVQLFFAAPSPAARSAFERGEKALSQGQVPEAEAAYREAISQTADYAEALNGLGSTLFKQGKRDDAIAQFKAAIKADPAFKLAYFNLGYAARKVNDYGTAAQAYEKYTALEPEDPDGFYGLGEAHRHLNDAKKAIAAYEQFIAKEKRPAEQKWVERAKELVASLRQTASASTGTAGAGVAVARSHSAGRAAALTDGSSDRVEQQIAEGDTLLKAERFEQSVAAFRAAVNAAPDNTEALFKLGIAEATTGAYTSAIERWERVLQLTNDEAVKKAAGENIRRARAKR